MPRTVKKSRLVSLQESFLGGKPEAVDREHGVIRGVKVCGRTSPNSHGQPGAKGTEYTLDCLTKALPLYEGINVNVDHPDRKNPGKDRSAYDRFAWIDKAVIRDDGIFGDLHFLDAKDPLAVRMMNAAELKPDAFGLSHNAYGKGSVVNGRYVVTEIPEVRHVDIVADAGSTRSLFESRTMKKTLLEALTELKISKDQLTALWEMGDVAPMMQAETPMPPPAPEAPGYEEHLGNAILAIINDPAMSPQEKKKKVLQAIKLLGNEQPGIDENDTEGAPEGLGDGDEGGDSPPEKGDEEKKKMKESREMRAELDALKLELAITKLCESEDFKPTTLQKEILEKLDEKKRKAFILESKAAKPKVSPRSSGTVRLQESTMPRDAKEQAAFLLRN